MIVFSFNDPTGRSNLTWSGFSLDAWLDPLGRPGLAEAVFNSLLIALLSTPSRHDPGRAHGAGAVRHPFRGRGATNLLIFLPMSTPEIVLGTSLLTLFIALGPVGVRARRARSSRSASRPSSSPT